MSELTPSVECQRLAALCAGHLGVVLKIETRRGFENLPELLFAALSGPAAGVMIARGDLAVECGFERLAEVQEEILWVCEAAHMPVVWATQVLENHSTHWRTGSRGKTWSARWAAVSTIRRVLQAGQTPRPLHDQAMRKS